MDRPTRRTFLEIVAFEGPTSRIIGLPKLPFTSDCIDILLYQVKSVLSTQDTFITSLILTDLSQ